MTTGKRVLISQASVEAALAEWHIERAAAERGADQALVEKDRARTYERLPRDYAQDLAPYVFSLLMKYAEET